MSTAMNTAVSLDDTWGVYYIGVVLGTALWGSGCVQMYNYYQNYRNDYVYLKILVAVVYLLDTSQVILQAIGGYFILVTKYGQPEFLVSVVSVTHRVLVWILLSGISIILVQAYYVTRIWRLSDRNHFSAGALCLVLGAELGVTSAYFARIYRMNSVMEWLEITWLGKMINAFDAGSSVLITGLIIFYLQRNRTGFKPTETMINRLIIFSVNTGLLTSIDTVLGLIFIVVMPSNFVYIAVYCLVSKLYFNSFLATLNSRNKIREATQASCDDGISFSSILQRTSSRSRATDSAPIAIKIHSESRTTGDADSVHFEKD